jgi:hypothetical protein
MLHETAALRKQAGFKGYTVRMKKLQRIILHGMPIIIMIGLIPLILNDYLLTGIYALIILISFGIKLRTHEVLIFFLGFIFMFFSEVLFVRTGVETFTRNSLFGIMPLWLPFIWGYGFVVIRRSIEVLYQR